MIVNKGEELETTIRKTYQKLRGYSEDEGTAFLLFAWLSIYRVKNKIPKVTSFTKSDGTIGFIAEFCYERKG